MQLFNSLIKLSFNYPTVDQETGLYVQADIYDVTTGSPVSVAQVALSEIQNGFYFGDYQPQAGKSYLVIALVYTDHTYAVVDTSYAPWAECYKPLTGADETLFICNYGVFSQNSLLDVAANIYDVTTGSAVFVSQIAMPHVKGGVYFTSFNGEVDHSYENLKFVYTDSGLGTVDADYGPGSDIFQLYSSIVEKLIIFDGAVLKGQDTLASLKGQTLSAILKEAQ